MGRMNNSNSSPKMARTSSKASMEVEETKGMVELVEEYRAEARGSKREAILVMILQRLSISCSGLGNVPEPELHDLVKAGLRKAGNEGHLSCNILMAIWIICEEDDDTYEEFKDILTLLIKNSTGNFRASSISCLALISLYQDVDNSTNCELLDTFHRLLRLANTTTTDSDEVVSLLNAYGLLYPLSTTRPDDEDFAALIELHSTFLESTNLDVRLAAGENIAIFYHDCFNEREVDGELIKRLTALSLDGLKFKAKKERAVQRSSFRDILRSVEEDVLPTLLLKFKADSVTFEGFSEIRELSYLTGCLGDGLGVHLIDNTRVQSRFNWSIGMDRTASSRQSGRLRSKTLKEQRSLKRSV